MGGFSEGGGGGQGGRPPFFPCIFEKFLTLSLTFGHKFSQNDVKQHHQFLRPPLSGFSGSAPDYNLKIIFVGSNRHRMMRALIATELQSNQREIAAKA